MESYAAHLRSDLCEALDLDFELPNFSVTLRTAVDSSALMTAAARPPDASADGAARRRSW